jgi:putative hemolysin
MSPIIPELAIILFLTIVNGLFAMSEVALLAARKGRLQNQASQGNVRAGNALVLQQDPNNFLSTVQVGITLVGVLSGAFGGVTIAEGLAGYFRRFPLLAPYAEAIGISVVVLGVSYLLLILGELVPKRLALHSPESVAASVARPMTVLAKVGAPLVSLLSSSTNAVLALCRLKEDTEPAVSEEDVRELLRQGGQSGVFEAIELQIVDRLFELSDRPVSTLMTRRADIGWMDVNQDYSAWRRRAADSPHTTFLMCDGQLDSVLGVISGKDLLDETEKADVRRLLTQPIVIPKHITALRVLEQLQRSAVHLAVVMDAEDKVAGVLTSTAILEALVEPNSELGTGT